MKGEESDEARLAYVFDAEILHAVHFPTVFYGSDHDNRRQGNDQLD